MLSRFAKNIDKRTLGCGVATRFLRNRIKDPGCEPQDFWHIDIRGIAAQTEALLRVAGPKQGVDSLMRWRPRDLVLRVAIILASKLITSGEASLVERCLA